MKRYNVKITSKALGDMESIYNYIAYTLLSPDTAMKQYNKIANKIEKLDMFPERYKILDLYQENTMGIRRMDVDNYSVFYIINNTDVTIIRVLYSASDIESRLKYNY